METKKNFTINIVTYLAQCGVTAGTTGLCSAVAYRTFGKTKLGRVFAFTTSVCAGLCTAEGLRDMLRSGAEYSVNALVDGAKAIGDMIEFRKEDIQETQEDEAN